MLYYWFPLLSAVLATAAPLADLVTPLPPLWNEMRVKHTWNAVPANWESLGSPPAGTTIDLHIALKPQHENALIDALYEVSTPRHPKYGAHLSMEEVAKLVTPHPDTLELVYSWFEHHGVPSSSISTTHGGGWLTLTAVPVSQANEMLSASYQMYRHSGKNDTAILRTVGYALPTVLHTHVRTVAPTTHFSSMRTVPQTPRMRSVRVGEKAALARVGSGELVTVLSRRNEMITPTRLRWLYKTLAYPPAATDENVLGVAGYLEEYPSPVDLTTFMNAYRADAKAATFTVEKVNHGGYDPSNPGLEANQNIQYAQAFTYPTPTVFYSIGGELQWPAGSKEPAPGDADLEWLQYLLRQPKIPQTITASYGIDEKDLPLEYATALCNLFAELGLRGVSVLFATGNGGVGDGDCKVKDDPEKVQFVPWFPASCPWVTSVGGTRSQLPEIAANLSGGGFSDHFPRPDYQNGVVPAFLQHLGTQYEGSYNSAGRGIPDISAQAMDYLFVVNEIPYKADGTSLATPTVAGIISLLNDYLLSNGKPPLGFLNPFLYGDGLAGLNDITYGFNPGCDTDGFSAIAGWDPVTGLGTPNFIELQYILDSKVILGNV